MLLTSTKINIGKKLIRVCLGSSAYLLKENIMLGINVDDFRNHIIIAVERLGGPTKAAHATGVSNATIHNWMNRRFIANIDKAKLMASLTGFDVQQLRATR